MSVLKSRWREGGWKAVQTKSNTEERQNCSKDCFSRVVLKLFSLSPNSGRQFPIDWIPSLSEGFPLSPVTYASRTARNTGRWWGLHLCAEYWGFAGFRCWLAGRPHQSVIFCETCVWSEFSVLVLCTTLIHRQILIIPATITSPFIMNVSFRIVLEFSRGNI